MIKGIGIRVINVSFKFIMLDIEYMQIPQVRNIFMVIAVAGPKAILTAEISLMA